MAETQRMQEGILAGHFPDGRGHLMSDPQTCCPQTEQESILAADHEIQMAQYRALHNRLEDYTRWMIEMGFLAKNAIAGPPPGIGVRSDYEDFLFEHIEAYLDQANEHEDRGPLDQILRPDMDEGVGEPDYSPLASEEEISERADSSTNWLDRT